MSNKASAGRFVIAAVGALALLPWPSAIAASLVCESDGYYRRCPADTRAGVRVARELGSVRCIQGDSWGHDDGGVWVDRGCRAEFALGGAAAPDQQAAGPRPMPPGPAPAEGSPPQTSQGADGGGGMDTTTAILGAVGVAAAVGAAAALLGGEDDKDKDERKKKIDNAKEACRRAANREGYRDVEVKDSQKDGREIQIDLKMKANGRRVAATCDYDARSKRARIYALNR